MSTIKSFFARLRKKNPKASNVVEAEREKSNVTVESFVMKYEDVFNGLLTGKNVIVYSDSDTDVEVDRPPPPPIQVRLTKKFEKLDKQKQKKQAAIDKINKRKANARKRSLMLLAKRRAREKGIEMKKPATRNGGTKQIEEGTESKKEKVKVAAETIPKLEVKGVAKQTDITKKTMRWRNFLTKTTAFRKIKSKNDNSMMVMDKKTYESKKNKDLIVVDDKKDENIDKDIAPGNTIINDLNSKEKKEALRLAKGSTTTDTIPKKENEDESRKVNNKQEVTHRQIINVKNRMKKGERKETRKGDKEKSEVEHESKEEKTETKNVTIAEASSLLIKEEENNENTKDYLSRICKKHKVQKLILRSTKYFVFAFFLEIVFILSILIPTEQPKCCVSTTRDVPWVKNLTNVVKNRSVLSQEHGIDQVTFCEKNTNPNEAFLDVCDDGTARQKFFMNISIAFGCLLISSFLFYCRLRYKIRKGHPIYESLLNFVVYIIFICIPFCSLPFQILNPSPVGIGRDLQLIICGLLSWTWLFFLGKSNMKYWSKAMKTMSSVYTFLFIIIPISITICSFAWPSYKDAIIEIVPANVALSLFGILSMMWLSSVTVTIGPKQNDIKRSIHEKIMRLLHVGLFEVFVIFPISLSVGLVAEGLYVSPGSVTFHNHPVLEVSGMLVSFALISMICLSIVRQKLFRTELPAWFRWGYCVVLASILCVPIPYFAPLLIFHKLQTSTNDALLSLIFAPLILIIMWNILTVQRVVYYTTKLLAAKKKETEAAQFFNDNNKDAKTTKDPKSKREKKKLQVAKLDSSDRSNLKKYVMKVWVPSTFVYVGFVVSCLPPYIAMNLYKEYFLPLWIDEPLDELETPSYLFFLAVLGIGNLVCQYSFHTVWRNTGCCMKWLNVLVIHAAIIIPIGMYLFLIYESARCKISSIVSQINTTTYERLERFSYFDAHFVNTQRTMDQQLHCNQYKMQRDFILIAIGIGILYVLWTTFLLQSRNKRQCGIKKACFSNALYILLVVPTLPVVLYDWGTYYISTINPTDGLHFEVPTIKNNLICGHDVSLCPDPKGMGVLVKPVSDIFTIWFFIGTGWLLLMFITTTNCFAKRRKCVQFFSTVLIAVFVIIPISLLWHYRSVHVKRWERWHEVNDDKWVWCLKAESKNCIVDSFKIDDNNTTMGMISATTATTTTFPKLRTNPMPNTAEIDLFSEILLICYAVGGVHLTSFLLLVDFIWPRRRRFLSYIFMFVYIGFVGIPTATFPSLIYHSEYDAYDQIRVSVYFGLLMCLGVAFSLTTMVTKMNKVRRLISITVYMLCFALPTSFGVYKLKLEVNFGGTEINVAASTFVGLFIVVFERYDAYKTKEIPLINRLIIFLLWITFITVPLLLVALTAYKDFSLLFAINILEIPFYMSLAYALWVGFTLIGYISMYSGYLQEYKQPYASLFPGIIMMIGEAIFFAVLRENYMHRSESDELPIFEFTMVFIFPLYLLSVFGIAGMKVLLLDKFILFSIFGVLGPTYMHLEDMIYFDNPESNLAKMYTFFIYAIPVGSMCGVFLPTLTGTGVTLVDITNIYGSMIILPVGAFVPIHMVSVNNTFDGLIISGIVISLITALIMIMLTAHKRAKFLEEEVKSKAPRFVRPDGFGWLKYFPINTMQWISHWVLLISLLILMYVSKHVSTQTRRGAVYVLCISAPIMYIIGNNSTCWKCCAHKVSLVLIGAILITALVMTAFLQSDKSLSTSIISGVLTVSGMMISFGILKVLKWSMAEHPRQEHVSTIASTLCCVGILFPFGVLFPSLASTSWDMSLNWATTFVIGISILIFICLVDVSSVTIAINSTLDTIEYEKRAKAAIKRIQKILKKRHENLEADPDCLRSMYDHAIVASHQKDPKAYEEFEKGLQNQTILLRVQKKKTVKLLDAAKANQMIKSHKINLCPKCDKQGWKTIITKRKKLRICLACNLQFLLDEKDRIRRLKAASAEEKEKLRREKERLYKIEVEKRKKRNEKFMRAQKLVAENKPQEALSLYNELLDEDGFNPNYLCSRSVVYSKLKRFEEAYQDANEALTIRPNYMNAYIAKATAQGSLKQWKEAVQTYSVGRKHFPRSKELFEAQKFAVAEMKRTAPPLNLFQYLKRKILFLSRALDQLEQNLEMGIAKFEEELASAGKSLHKNLSGSKSKKYGGRAFLMQLVEISGVDTNTMFKAFKCKVTLKPHPNKRGYEEVRKDLPDVKERIQTYVKETRELDDINALFWRKELAYFPQVILPGHLITVTLYGFFDATDDDNVEEEDIANTRTTLGSVTFHSHNIARLCRNNTYHHFDIIPPSVAIAKKKDSTVDKKLDDKTEPEKEEQLDVSNPDEFTNDKKKNQAMRLGMLFSLCSPKVAAIQSSMQKKNTELLLSIVNEWRNISVPPARITRRVMREVFGTYASHVVNQVELLSKQKGIQKPMSQEEMLAQLEHQLKLQAEQTVNTAAEKKQSKGGVHFQRLSRSKVYTMYLTRGQFEKLANDTLLDANKSSGIFMEVATTEHTGKFAVNFKEFKKVVRKLAKLQFPSFGKRLATRKFCLEYIRRRSTIYKRWRKINDRRLSRKVPKVIDPRAKALEKARIQNAALYLQRIWKKRRLRIKAIALIRRFIKRKAEWRKAHPLELLENQMSQMTQEEEEEIPPMEDDKKRKKKTCISKLGHFILGTKEEVEDVDSDSDDEDTIDKEKDMEGLTPDERTKLTIYNINKCREGKNWDAVVDTILSQMKNEVERDTLRLGTSSADVLVNWKHSANVMAFHVALPKMLYQYYSIAAAHGPLEPTKNTRANLEDSTTEMVNTDFLKGIAGVVSLPKFSLPDVDPGISSFHFTFWGAVAIAFMYPIYTIKALRQLKAGKLGLDKHGRPVTKFCTKDGLYNFGLNAVNDYLYFGMMVQFVSIFACKIDDLAPQPGELNFKYVKYILMADAKYIKIPNFGVNGTISNYTVGYAYPPMECFNPKQPAHIMYMAVCTIAILCFYPLATLLAPNFQFNNKMLDIKFHQSFLIVQNQAELLMVAFSIFYQESWAAVLIPQMVICMTLAFSNWFIQPCLIERLNVFRTGVYAMAAVSCFSSIMYQVLKEGFGGIYCYPKDAQAAKAKNVNCEPFLISSGISVGILVVGWLTISLMTLYFYKTRRRKTIIHPKELESIKVLEDDAIADSQSMMKEKEHDEGTR
jgi:hypothetical protein